MSMNGIDISNYQATLDLAKVPCDFVIVKATQGTSYVNPSCDKHVQQALKLNKPFGVYHYISGVGATAEADYFIDNCKNYIGHGILCLDWESNQNNEWGNESYLESVVDRIKTRTGINPIIYVQASRYQQVKAVADRQNCGLWIAQYANNNTTGYQTTPWNEGAYTCAIRQYASNGHLNGYDGALDLDKFYGDLNAWNKYAGATTTTTVKPAATTTTPTTTTPTIIAGKYVVTVDALKVRNKPSLSGKALAQYSKGQTVTLQAGGTIADGYIWAHYKAYSGKTRYLALCPVTKKTWYLKRV